MREGEEEKEGERDIRGIREGEKGRRERHTLLATLSDQCFGKSPATSILSPAPASVTFSLMSSPDSIC